MKRLQVLDVPAGAIEELSKRGRNIILFDGICNLCTASVIFILERDPQAVFRFASLQSASGRDILRLCGIPATYSDSILYIEDGRVRIKSDAALRIVTKLNGLWPGLAMARVIPAPARDALYDWIARNRYSIFGRKRSCMAPTAAIASRFL